MNNFKAELEKNKLRISRERLKTIQINLGKLCNQSCLHCHVNAGPNRQELMSEKTIDHILYLLKKSPSIETIDITGGAPELNPNYKKLVRNSRKQNLKILSRTNLTVLFEDGQEDTPQFFKENSVELVVSLPCYLKENVDKQRGVKTYDKSIEALKLLNKIGYGTEGSKLYLNLVYNPLGAHLPSEQASLERDYKINLKEKFGIEFNKLFTITNVPITRFKKHLEKNSEYRDYMELLSKNFNSEAAKAIMCTKLLSISWNGNIYDCDFNQILNLEIGHKAKTIWEIKDFEVFNEGKIAFGNHCFACCAGAGSSCTGALT